MRPMSSDLKGLWNMSIDDGASIPKGSTFYCTEAPLTIGKKVIFGPHPTNYHRRPSDRRNRKIHHGQQREVARE